MTVAKELEWKTRKERVDKKLAALNPAWKIVPFKTGLDTTGLHAVAVAEYPTASGPADYALFVRGRLLGFIEAKKVTIGPQNAIEESKRYSRTTFDGPGNWRGYRVPFLYSTNGEKIFFMDVRRENNRSREIADFHTADALEEIFARSTDFYWFPANPVSGEKLRHYQKAAIEKIEDAICRGEYAMLLAI